MSVIRLESVSKTYSRRAPRQFLRSYLFSWLRPVPHERYYALKAVSLDLREGDCLGVLGPNGAGKSTLLSLVAGLSWPDAGKIDVHGQVAALLELGSGFHPDLTGAENVFLNAALLGFTRRRTLEKFDEIVDFSGMRDFVYEPLRTYSAGMMLRLAFSVAMAVEPDILLIDEVLAVGDQAFQAKCIGKILALKRAGRVLICASHDMDALRQLSTRAIWLDHGVVLREGPAGEVIDAYAATLSGNSA